MVAHILLIQILNCLNNKPLWTVLKDSCMLYIILAKKNFLYVDFLLIVCFTGFLKFVGYPDLNN